MWQTRQNQKTPVAKYTPIFPQALFQKLKSPLNVAKTSCVEVASRFLGELIGTIHAEVENDSDNSGSTRVSSHAFFDTN
jgi:hypothetical protein